MKIIPNLEQGSEAWLNFRKSHIGASESAALLGMNRYTSSVDLWMEKTGRAFIEAPNENMIAGKEVEPVIRAEYEMKIGKKYTTPTAEHSDYNFISASFDGYCEEDGSIIEVKFSKYPKLSTCLKSNSVEMLKIEYPHYFVQCQQLMFISDAKECPIITISPEGEMLSLMIPRDETFIQETLLPKTVEFWNENIVLDIEPQLIIPEFINIDTLEAINKASELKDITGQLKALQAREKAIKDELAEMGDDGDIIIGNMLKMKRVSRKGSVDTKALYKEFSIMPSDLERFRKPEIGYYSFSFLT